jgi:hypothetical protein
MISAIVRLGPIAFYQAHGKTCWNWKTSKSEGSEARKSPSPLQGFLYSTLMPLW